MPVPQKGPCHKPKSALGNRVPPAHGLVSVTLWHCFSSIFFPSPGPGLEALIPIKSSSVNPLVWWLLVLECLQHPYSLRPFTLHLSAMSVISPMISSSGSVVNSAMSCTASGHGFLHQEFIVSGLVALRAFSVTTMHLQWYDPPRLPWHSLCRGLFHGVESFPQRPCAMTWNAPYHSRSGG